MPLKKKKNGDLMVEVSHDKNIEKSFSSPDISSPTGNSEDETKELSLKRSESQRIRKSSWFKRLMKPFRRFRRNTTTECFSKESKSNSEFHTSLSTEIVFDNLTNGTQSEKSREEDENYEVVDSGEKRRNDVKRKSTKRPAPSTPFNGNVIQELKRSLDQKIEVDSKNSSPTLHDHPVYENEADLRNMASTRRRQSLNADLEKQLSGLEAIYEDTWNVKMTSSNIDISSTGSHIRNSKTGSTLIQNQVDELDFIKNTQPQPIESLFSKFPKPKLPKRKPSRRGSRPEEYLIENVAEFQTDQTNRKESLTNRRSHAELDVLIQQLTEIQPPKTEDLPKLPPAPKRRTIFNSSSNLTFENEIKSTYTITDENISNNEPIYLSLEDNIRVGSNLIEKPNQFIKTNTDDNIKTFKPALPQKTCTLLTRNNSFPRSKMNPFVCKTAEPIIITNDRTIFRDSQQNYESQLNSENDETGHFKRSYTLPTQQTWSSETISKSTKTKCLTVKKEVRSTSESNEYTESENTILTQDGFTQTSMTNIESILGGDFKNIESTFQEFLNDIRSSKNADQSTPPNTPEQMEANEEDINSNSINGSAISSEFKSVAVKMNNQEETTTDTTVMTKLVKNEITDKKSSGETLLSIHNTIIMSSNCNKGSFSDELSTTSLETNARVVEHQEISNITAKTPEICDEPTKSEVNGVEIFSISPREVCRQDLSKKPQIKGKPPVLPKPLNIIPKHDDFVRRGAVRRKSNSTSDDHPISQVHCQLSKSPTEPTNHAIHLKHGRKLSCDKEPIGSP